MIIIIETQKYNVQKLFETQYLVQSSIDDALYVSIYKRNKISNLSKV